LGGPTFANKIHENDGEILSYGTYDIQVVQETFDAIGLS